MNKYLEIREVFEIEENKQKAFEMSKYMRNKFSFYGIATPKEKKFIKIS